MLSTLLRTLISRFLLFFIMVVFAIPMFIIIMVPKRWLYDSKLFYRFVHFFYWLIIKCSFIPITFHGLENMPHQPSIIISNHQSSLDIPLVGYTLHAYPHIWLAIAYLMKSPILRFILPKLAILVDMSSPLKGMRSLNQALKCIEGKDRHIVIFPEGGRYVDAKVHEFFAGFAILAKKTGRPVVPIRIFGAYKVYPPNSFLVRYYPINVVIGKPITMNEDEDIKAFKKRVRAWFLAQKEPKQCMR